MVYKGFKRDLLMFLGLLSDLHGELSYTTFYKRLYWPNYKPKYVSQMISKMARVGEIQKEVIDGEPVLKLTAQGWQIFNETVPLRKRRKWDGIWRMVIFDIKERNRRLRDNLRRKLKELGFGKWQRSVYITPHNIMQEMNEFLEAKALFPKCVCLEAKRAGIGNDKELAARVFKLRKLNREYKRLTVKTEDLRTAIESKDLRSPKEARTEFGEIWDDFRELLLKDPYLPYELLPENWYAEESHDEFKRLVKVIGAIKQS